MAGKKTPIIKNNGSSWKSLKSRGTTTYGNVTSVIRKKPVTSFLGILGLLLVLIIISNMLSTPKATTGNSAIQAKKVSLYNIGTSPEVSLPAKIEKNGVVKIVAQTAGVVQSVNVTEGDTVNRGSDLLDLSTTYQGGDASGIQAQIAQTQYDNTNQTYTMQQDLIAKQRDVATISAQNTDQLRQISQQSIDATNSLITLDQSTVDSLNQNIVQLTASNQNGSNDAAILQTKQLVSQFQSGLNQLQSGVNQTQYQTNTANPPTLLANLQKDITLKQLDIQQKGLDLSKEVGALQLNLANLNESLMHPASPVSGTVERINVAVGQTVSPGTILATITSDANNPDVTAVVSVPNTIAQTVSRMEPSTLHIGNKTYRSIPRYISSEATDGTMYTVLYTIPQDYQGDLTNNGYITIDMPIGMPNTSGAVPFIPLDAIYQNQDQAYVYLNKNGVVQSKTVQLGQVFGSFAQISSGLTTGDQVITDRNIVAGDKITTK